MPRLGIFVGENNWTFFTDIFQELAAYYETSVYQRKFYRVPLLQGRLNHWSYLRSVQSMLRHNDLCFFEWASELLMVASHLPKTCAVVTRLHSFEIFEWAPKINWHRVDRVILLSEAMRNVFTEQYPDHAHKTRVVFNGRPLPEFTPPVQKQFSFTLGMLGHVTGIKRVYEVVLMLYSLRRQGYSARLTIAGKPTDDLRYAAATYRLVKELDLEDVVTFEGHVDQPANWLQTIDIFISNSYWEGQQVALIEAMASGCYCLSHCWAGADEMLPPEHIYITETQLLQKIIAYSELPASERRQIHARMRAIACERFDVERMKTEIRQVIQEVA